MLFKKLKFSSLPLKKKDADGHESWYMILQSLEDIMTYMEMGSGYFANAMFSLHKNMTHSHLDSPRERVLAIAMQHAVASAPEGTQVWPHQVTADFIQKKAMGMATLFLNKGPIQVNQVGGYCDHDSFMKQWEPQVVVELEKDSTFFPTDDEAIKADLLFLENAERVDIDFFRSLVGHNNPYDYNYKHKISTIALLKERDPKWVAKSIMLSDAVAICTMALDDNQNDQMMKLFSSESMPVKTIYLRIPEPERITSHPLWKDCSSKHTIKFC